MAIPAWVLVSNLSQDPFLASFEEGPAKESPGQDEKTDGFRFLYKRSGFSLESADGNVVADFWAHPVAHDAVLTSVEVRF